MKVMIVGQAFNKNGEPIGIERDMSKYKKSALWTIGNGKKEYYLFTDPECPFCQMFEKNLDKLKSNVKLYVFLFPLKMHKDAVKMSKYILSKKDRAKAIKNIANGNDKYQKANFSKIENNKLSNLLKNSENIGKKLEVRGTPTVINSKGIVINWKTLFKQ